MQRLSLLLLVISSLLFNPVFAESETGKASSISDTAPSWTVQQILQLKIELAKLQESQAKQTDIEGLKVDLVKLQEGQVKQTDIDELKREQDKQSIQFNQLKRESLISLKAHGNRISDTSNSIDRFGIILGIVGVLITLLVTVVSYVSARLSAKSVTEKWAMFSLPVGNSLNLRDPSSIMLEISDETARFQYPHLSIRCAFCQTASLSS